VRRYDKENPEFSDMKANVVKHALKRKVRIAVKKPVKLLKSMFNKD
jgi:hypothetical protein